MDHNGTACPQTHRETLPTSDNPTSIADYRLLKTWETDRSMHLGTMLRIRQIRRANPHLAVSGEKRAGGWMD
jgi:hypothetical protein